MATEPSFVFRLEFFDEKGNELIDARLQSLIILNTQRIEDRCEKQVIGFINHLVNDMYFDNFGATPGFIYDIDEDIDGRWRFAMNKCKEKYFQFYIHRI